MKILLSITVIVLAHEYVQAYDDMEGIALQYRQERDQNNATCDVVPLTRHWRQSI